MKMNVQNLSANARLAYDAIQHQPREGIPSGFFLPMEHSVIDRLAGAPEGEYVKNPEEVYLQAQKKSKICLIDQFIPRNPLSMAAAGYEADTEKRATTGAERIVLDDMVIDSPEAAVEHLEKFVWPDLKKQIDEFDVEEAAQAFIDRETGIQDRFGPDILKTGHGKRFPALRYGAYGYENYFMAYALFPDVMEKDFSLQADLAMRRSEATVKAYETAGLPPLFRLDHDMADGRGTLVDIKSLDEIWFPHFDRSIAPLVKAGVNLIWHCDGNLMDMVPRLLDCGLRGFQGFQYEYGMDYEKICRMKSRDGESLLIIGGVSVTTTLPKGTPDDVKKELKWLVENGPEVGLILGGTSSITPGTPYENIKTLVEGFDHYRQHGRKGI